MCKQKILALRGVMQEISNLRELKKRQYLLYVIIMLSLFLVMLTYTIVWCVVFNKNYGTFVEVDAEVVALGDDNVYGLKYFDSVNGVEITNNTTTFANGKSVGEKIAIYYDTESPLVVTDHLSSGRYLLPIITSVYGVVSATLSIIFFVSFYGKNSTMQIEKKHLNIAEIRKQKMTELGGVVLKNKNKVKKPTN